MVWAGTPPARTLSPQAEECLACHGSKDGGAPHVPADVFAASRHAALSCSSCHESIKGYPHEKVSRVLCGSCHGEQQKALAESFHAKFLTVKAKGGNACVACHGNHGVKDPRSTARPLCTSCHDEQTAQYIKSVHGSARLHDDLEAAACYDCHGAHDIRRKEDPLSRVYPLNLPETCGKCHGDLELAKRHNIATTDAYKLYIESSHGRAVKKSGLLVSANCSSCHGSHGILPKNDISSSVNRRNVPGTCGKCHAGVLMQFRKSIHGKAGSTKAAVCTDCHRSHGITRIDESHWKVGLVSNCGNCHDKLFKEYKHSYHGKVTSLGYVQTAKCSDCHGAHDIVAVDDPASRVRGERKIQTCAKCHAGAGASFASYVAHPSEQDKQNQPLLYWVALAFALLLSGTFAFWGLHSFLWLVRASISHWPPKPEAKKAHREEKHYWRFPLYHRLTHAFIIASFLGLALTGLPLKYSEAHWASELSHLFGGFHMAGLLHRFCALITFGYAVFHLSWVVRRFLATRDLGLFWGPASLVPQPKDLLELWDHSKWFMGLGPRPRFGRWTYWEKFDYWAVFWGIAIIGSTGLVLWFPLAAAHMIPGWLVNVAMIIHSDEALLAVGFIFTIHFFNTHLRPGKFPMDEVIFTGRLSEEELKEDKPGQYEELKASGELESLRAAAPSLRVKVLGRMLGFIAVATGLTLIALIILAAWRH